MVSSQSFAESEWQTQNVVREDQTFRVPYKITNGEVVNIQADLGSIVLHIKSDEVSEGDIEIVIPRDLLDRRDIEDGSDESFFVLAGDREVEYQELKNNSCYRAISVQFHKGVEKLEILSAYQRSVEELYSVLQPLNIISNTIYNSGETVVIEGCTSLALDEGGVRIDVLDPQGKIYKTLSVMPQIDGTFSTSFVLDDKDNFDAIYSVTATYGNYTAVPEFSGIGLIILATTLSVVLVTKLIPQINDKMY